MYGLEVVQYRDVSQIYPPYCVLPYRVMDKIVHYSKMSKTRKKPRKSFHERWEHSQKRVGSATCWGNDDWQSVRFSDRPGTRHFIAPIWVYCVLPQTHTTNRPNFGCLPCDPSVGFHAEMRRVHDFSSRRVDKNRSERRVGGYRGIRRTWPGAEHFTLHPHFHTFSSVKIP